MDRRKNICRLLTILACASMVAALWFGYSFWRTLKEYERGEKDIDQIYEVMGGFPQPIPGGELAQMDEIQKDKAKAALNAERLAGYRKIYETNDDTIGWVRIEGTVIDYPVMHTPDNPDFYLKHGFDRQSSAYGMIYMDASCRLDDNCHNYLLYGHHMKNGSMFASLEQYTSEEYFENHPVIGFDTLEKVCDYEVVAVFKLPASMLTAEFAHMLAAENEEDYEALVAYAAAHRFYDTGIIPQWPEQLLTLTTCEYSQKNGRLLVIARVIPEQENQLKRQIFLKTLQDCIWMGVLRSLFVFLHAEEGSERLIPYCLEVQKMLIPYQFKLIDGARGFCYTRFSCRFFAAWPGMKPGEWGKLRKIGKGLGKT